VLQLGQGPLSTKASLNTKLVIDEAMAYTTGSSRPQLRQEEGGASVSAQQPSLSTFKHPALGAKHLNP